MIDRGGTGDRKGGREGLPLSNWIVISFICSLVASCTGVLMIFLYVVLAVVSCYKQLLLSLFILGG